MKDFSSWGIKTRKFPEYNYNGVWHNLLTWRTGSGQALELPPEKSEFYDVGLGTKCNATCPFCYVSATKDGIFYEDICETWNKWMDITPLNDRPFQIAIGSSNEPTIHPEFLEFIKTVYESGVVPNYTTNGITLSKLFLSSELKEILEAQKLLEYTEKYCGGVAVSCNKHLEEEWIAAVRALMSIDVHINLHYIISDKKSVDEFIKIYDEFSKDVLYFVLLPLMPAGRSKKGVEQGTWEYLESKIENREKIAFGAHFVDYLKDSKIRTWLYPPESFSKNVILTKDKVQITPSSFNMNPIKIIKL